jgi:2-hydroxycyclohexanecarboxyl-CoA dehydrogenase
MAAMTGEETKPKRTAVVTGASSLRGIGFATALRYAQDGWAVALADINEAGVHAAATEVKSRVPGSHALAFTVDVADEGSVAALAEQVRKSRLPQVAALANIAGIPSLPGILDQTLAEWNRVMAINLTGTFLMSRAFVPQMVAGGYGRVVNMSSVTGQHGGGVFSRSTYAAAKAGVLGLTRGMARELAQYGITVNAITPGAVETDIRAAATDDAKEAALRAAVPLGRLAWPSEIAALVVWLSGEDAAYITGATHNINGGSYIA